MSAEQTQRGHSISTEEGPNDRQTIEALFRKGRAILGVTDDTAHEAQAAFVIPPSLDHPEASRVILSYNPPTDGIPQRLSVMSASLMCLPLSDLAQVPIKIFFHADIFYPEDPYPTIGRDSSNVLTLPQTLAQAAALLQQVPSSVQG